MRAIELHSVSKSFEGVKALDRLSCWFPRGRITGIIGPNGSGKTTLINALTGILRFDSGQITLNDSVRRSNLTFSDLSAFGITRTFQNIRVFEQMSVLDNVLVVVTERTVFGALFERHSDAHANRAEEALRRVRLWDKRRELAVNCSYGQRKLLELARALAVQAQIYLFDEPFAGLFPELVAITAEIMRELRSHGKTVVLVEHNMDLIRELSDHALVLDSGQLLAEGGPEAVLNKPEVVEAYLGE